MAGERYRWVVLAVGTAAQAAVSASWFAVAILAPAIRSEFGLSLTEIGVVLAAFTIGMTPTLLPSAALVLAASQLLGGVLRVFAGGWSDRLGSRIVPLCRLALGVTVGLVIVALAAGAPSWLLVPVLTLAGAIGLSWNGLPFVAAAEVAGAGASCAALGFQQMVLGIAGIAAPILIAALVSAASWQIAFLVSGLFPLLGWALMHPLAGHTGTATAEAVTRPA